ncbi:MAG: nucleotide sugar dehydrogenase [Gammaproteobacteria bacterium]
MNQAHQQLLARLQAREAVVGVVGLGYVGLPLALCFVDAGYRVVGIDSDPQKCAALNAGRSYIKLIGDVPVAGALGRGFRAANSFADAGPLDAVVICVPTPLDAHREPDLQYVTRTVDALLPQLRAGMLISLESTTYPGTTEEIIAARVSGAGWAVGSDVFVAYSPERQDPGNTRFGTAEIPKIVSGMTPACLQAAQALYAPAIRRLVPVSNPKTAEMAKLLENIHRAVNVGLVNEMKVVADRMGIDIFEVIEAAATKPFGFVPYYPGPGLGGHCIPIDPFYLTWKAREYHVHTRFIELAGEVNSSMPAWVVGKVAEALNSRRKAINGSRILVLGLSYKKNVDDTRESPSVEIMDLLQDRGAEVAYSDPWIARFPRMRKYAFDLESVPLTAAALQAFDCVVLATDHDAFDYALIGEASPLLVNARGRFREAAAHIFRA